MDVACCEQIIRVKLLWRPERSLQVLCVIGSDSKSGLAMVRRCRQRWKAGGEARHRVNHCVGREEAAR